ncbi:MAG: bacterial Ig-like domain-containing protein [Clostridia bacterium]|nr:bacterial Ig-like domain-containing protein [Clostridia bacterium]MBR5031542.1 bacterial Ig-like domain-containing protein [Clostridia bacterium]
MKLKRILCALLCLCALAGLLSASAYAENPLGDIDFDGDIDYDDCRLLFDYVAGSGFLSYTQIDASDIDGDGSVTPADAAQLLHYVSGALSALPYVHRGRGRLAIMAYPDKTEYIEGEELDMTGFELQIVYANGDILPVDDYSYSGYSSTPGIKIIVVSYAGARVAFVVTVYPAAP